MTWGCPASCLASPQESPALPQGAQRGAGPPVCSRAPLEHPGRFLEMHMYMTSALSKNDMKAIGLQMALDLLAAKEQKDSITGLRTRTQPGRPDWSKVRTGAAPQTRSGQGTARESRGSERGAAPGYPDPGKLLRPAGERGQ